MAIVKSAFCLCCIHLCFCCSCFSECYYR